MSASGSTNNAFGDSSGSRLVNDLRTKLSGTGMVLICGEPRADLKARIQKAFGLSTLYWPEAKHHKSPEHLKKFIRKADVGLLVIGVRFVSHAHTGLAAYGKKCGKLVVLLPRGYGLLQIACEMNNQLSAHIIQNLAARPSEQGASGLMPRTNWPVETDGSAGQVTRLQNFPLHLVADPFPRREETSRGRGRL